MPIPPLSPKSLTTTVLGAAQTVPATNWVAQPALPTRAPQVEQPAPFDLAGAKVSEMPANEVLAEKLWDEASQRAGQFRIQIKAQGPLMRPPASVSVDAGHVQRVLGDMLGERASQFIPESPIEPEELYQRLYDFGSSMDLSGGRKQPDYRFETGVKLTKAGRELMASHYKQKYQADIQCSDLFPALMSADIPGLIERGREQARHNGGDARCAYILNHSGGHGSLLVYIQEGGTAEKRGREALLWFDSTVAPKEDIQTGMAQACAPFAPPGEIFPVFQNTRPLQRAGHGCFDAAMKTAAVLTAREPDGQGGFGGFLIPNLIDSLNARRLKTPVSPGVYAVWVLPEVAKTAQSLSSVEAHAGPEIDQPLKGVKNGVTLRIVLEKYTYVMIDGSLMLDYMRQKVEIKWVPIVETMKWSELIGETAARHGEVWDAPRQGEFARRIKELVIREQKHSIARDIELLKTLTADPQQFISLATELLGRLESSMPDLSGHEGLVKLLSPQGLQELGEYCDQTRDQLISLGKAIDEGVAGFNVPTAWERRYPLTLNNEDVLTELSNKVTRRLDDLDSPRFLHVREKSRRERESVCRTGLLARLGNVELADAIASLRSRSIEELVPQATAVLEQINLAAISFSRGSGGADELMSMTDDQLKNFEADLDLHAKLLNGWANKCKEIVYSLNLPDTSDTDDDDDESETRYPELDVPLSEAREEISNKLEAANSEKERRAPESGRESWSSEGSD